MKKGEYNNDTVFVATVSSPYVFESKTDPIEEMLNNYKRGLIPNPNQLPALNNLLSRKEVEAMVVGDVLFAKECEQLKKRIRDDYTKFSIEAEKSKNISKIDTLIEKANKKYVFIQKEWEKNVRQYNMSEDERLAAISERQKRELSDFDYQWVDVNKMREFSKPSVQLLDMRKRERALLLANQYTEARKVQREADILEQKETESAQERAEDEIVRQREQLLDKHKRELEIVNEHRRIKIAEMKIEGENSKKAIEKRIRKLERDLQKVQSIRPKTVSSASYPSPRTSAMIRSFRQEPVHSRLPIKLEPRKSSSSSLSKRRDIVLPELPKFIVN